MERLILIWTRPDGEKAITIEFAFTTPTEVSNTLAEILSVVGVWRQDVQIQRQAVKDTFRGMEEQ